MSGNGLPRWRLHQSLAYIVMAPAVHQAVVGLYIVMAPAVHQAVVGLYIIMAPAVHQAVVGIYIVMAPAVHQAVVEQDELELLRRPSTLLD